LVSRRGRVKRRGRKKEGGKEGGRERGREEGREGIKGGSGELSFQVGKGLSTCFVGVGARAKGVPELDAFVLPSSHTIGAFFWQKGEGHEHCETASS
jgi:hypothetical protein